MRATQLRNVAIALACGLLAGCVATTALVGAAVQEALAIGLAVLLSAYAAAAMALPSGGFGAPTEYTPSPGTAMGGPAKTEAIRARYIVNAAGCASDKVAAMVGDTSWHVKPRYGEYILLHKDEGDKARHVLFPCPHPVF